MTAAEKQDLVQNLRQRLDCGDQHTVFRELRNLADPLDDYLLHTKYCKLARRLSPDVLGLQTLRVALLGTTSLQHFAPVLWFWLFLEGFNAEFYQPEFDTIHQTVLDAGSELYRFQPDIIWLYTHFRDLHLALPAHSDLDQITAAVQQEVNQFRQLWEAIRAHSPALILQNNCDVPAVRVLGDYEASVPWSPSSLYWRFNCELASALPHGVRIFDVQSIAAYYGTSRWSSPRYWFHSKHHFDFDASGLVAFHAARLIEAARGKARKCLILDLDNTIWGGVIGDDGLAGIRLGHGAEGEAFTAFQQYVLALKSRGVILAVCSKNDPDIAREPFQHHPDMVLHLEDIALFRASWQHKVDVIREIATTLNLGLDAMVFVDDNPAERELVRTMLPMVTVPEMPEDPADFVATLDRWRLFETISLVEEDAHRSELYRQNADRAVAQQQFTDVSDYLQHLEMRAEVGAGDALHLPRMAQLINKSNQFHLTGTRYTESELLALSVRPDVIIRYFGLRDRFGDNGLIAVVVLCQKADILHIDTWVMSCRVLSRGMEEFIMQEIVDLARLRGCTKTTGTYVPSKKNALVATLYERLRFEPGPTEPCGATHWVLSVSGAQPHYECYIQKQSGREEMQLERC